MTLLFVGGLGGGGWCLGGGGLRLAVYRSPGCLSHVVCGGLVGVGVVCGCGCCLCVENCIVDASIFVLLLFVGGLSL